MRSTNLSSIRLSALVAIVVAVILLAPRMAAATTTGVYYVAPGGSDAVKCATSAPAKPFATIQRALACATPGAIVRLAPDPGAPYPGIGAVAQNVAIQAQPGADARSVTVDAGKGALSVAPGVVASLAGVTLECPGRDCTTASAINEGTLTLSADAVVGNESLTSAILNTTPIGSSTPATLTIAGSTIARDAAKTGGGVYSTPGQGATGALTLDIADSTITQNLAQTRGGGVAIDQPTAGSSASIVGSTITANSAQNAGGGLWAVSPVTLDNTIIAANVTRTAAFAPDCEAKTATDGFYGHNLIGNGAGCANLIDGVDGDLVGAPRPGLLPLADNGGATDTVALQSSSPAIGAGDAEGCESSAIADLDQRGSPRKSAARDICDVGAYDTAGAGGVVHRTLFVAPRGSDVVACDGNSQTSPFATIGRALACAVDGDVVSLAPDPGAPYPGIGAVAQNVAIQAQPGADARSVTVDAGKGALSVAPGSVASLAGVTLACPANDCTSPSVDNEGTLTLSADTVTGNESATAAVINTTPAASSMPTGSSTPATLTIAGSTIVGNATKTGGGVYSTPGQGAIGALTLDIADSTIAQNFSLTRGGGVAIDQPTVGSSASIVNSTIAANTAVNGGGGLWASTPVTLDNTILAANTVRSAAFDPDCEAAKATDGPYGHNLIGDGAGCAGLVSGVDGDQVGAAGSPLDARLAPLAGNGGGTDTALPLVGSPAIGAGSAAACELAPVRELDQRGVVRNAAARDVCDVGAYDTAGLAVSSVSVKRLLADGKAKTVTIAGSGFRPGATLSSSSAAVGFGAVKVKSGGTITAKATVAAGAPSGSYDVTVSLQGTSATCAACLVVTAPRR